MTVPYGAPPPLPVPAGAASPPPLEGPRTRKPPWLKVRLRTSPAFHAVQATLAGQGLHTVCQEARCPNLHACWSSGTATFMLMGDACTRACRFCAVKTARQGRPLDPREPEKLARAVARFGLDYVVLTSVDRDDLEDGGAAHFAACVRAIKQHCPRARVETLIPDFGGNKDALCALLAAHPDVVAHNIETVQRLQASVRDPRADYATSLQVLRRAKKHAPAPYTKSGLMLGLGEARDEVLQAMDDLRAVGVDFLTLGQYLQPTPRHLPVRAYLPPETFQALAREGEKKGFRYVAAGPLVRSSYRAGAFFKKTSPKKQSVTPTTASKKKQEGSKPRCSAPSTRTPKASS